MSQRTASARPGARGSAPVAAPKPRTTPGWRAADWIALGLSGTWLSLTALFFVVIPRDSGSTVDPFQFVMTLLAVFLPIALIWIGATVVRSGRAMREENARLEAAVDALRAAYLEQAQSLPQSDGKRPPLEAKLDDIAKAQRKTEAAVARLAAISTLAPARQRPLEGPPALAQQQPRQHETSQPTLALATPPDVEPISTDDFIKALNFPEDEHDADGFRALRIALKDPRSTGLIRSSQDVLTLLAEDGIYMDDLAPDRAKPEVWRKFAEGARGRAVAGLGGVRDRSSLALAAGRMRQDPIFRDAAHHFLRKFDHAFSAFAPGATDADIVALSETRTARAFMLLGRVSGTFD